MNDQSIELRDLVHNLTREHRTPVYQHGRLLRYRTDKPLLTALGEARTANIGVGTGGTAAHERLTLNVQASELFASIQRRVRSWSINADVPRHWTFATNNPVDWTDPAQLLAAWHARTLGIAQFDERPYIGTLRSWTRAIEDQVIDPPRRWSITGPCPLCGAAKVLDLDGGQTDALRAIERDPVEDSTVVCGNCEAVWEGINGGRALRIAMDDQAARSAA